MSVIPASPITAVFEPLPVTWAPITISFTELFSLAFVVWPKNTL